MACSGRAAVGMRDSPSTAEDQDPVRSAPEDRAATGTEAGRGLNCQGVTLSPENGEVHEGAAGLQCLQGTVQDSSQETLPAHQHVPSKATEGSSVNVHLTLAAESECGVRRASVRDLS